MLDRFIYKEYNKDRKLKIGLKGEPATLDSGKALVEKRPIGQGGYSHEWIHSRKCAKAGCGL